MHAQTPGSRMALTPYHRTAGRVLPIAAFERVRTARTPD